MKISSQNFEQEKKTVAQNSVLAAVFITTLKFIVAIFTGSLGILSEAFHSAFDLIAATITLLAVKFSSRPADKSHNYGHGKIENISALVETLLLLATSFWIIFEAIKKILGENYNFQNSIWGFVVITISIIVDYNRSKKLSIVAKKHNSQALEADALHFSTDMFSSAAVLVGLFFAYFGFPIADAIAAIIVSVIILKMSIELGKKSIDDLMDRAPVGVEEDVLKIAENISGILKVANIRARNAWPRLFIDVTVEIARTIPFEVADSIVHNLEVEIHKKYPEADVMLHPEPVSTKNETLEEKIKLIFSRYNYTAHDIQIFKIKKQFHVDLSIEFEKNINFNNAHNEIDNIENEILNIYPEIKNIVVHIEDSRSKAIKSVEVKNSSQKFIVEVLKFLKKKTSVENCEIISALKVKGKYHFSIKCFANKNFSIEKIHLISTQIEREVLSKFSKCDSINIHIEPK